MGGGSAIEGSGAAVCGLRCGLRRMAGATSSLILIVGEEGTNSSGNVPTAGFEVFGSLFEVRLLVFMFSSSFANNSSVHTLSALAPVSSQNCITRSS